LLDSLLQEMPDSSTSDDFVRLQQKKILLPRAVVGVT